LTSSLQLGQQNPGSSNGSSDKHVPLTMSADWTRRSFDDRSACVFRSLDTRCISRCPSATRLTARRGSSGRRAEGSLRLPVCDGAVATPVA
jgi:hypothetical protein